MEFRQCVSVSVRHCLLTMCQTNSFDSKDVTQSTRRAAGETWQSVSQSLMGLSAPQYYDKFQSNLNHGLQASVGGRKRCKTSVTHGSPVSPIQ
eukprot:COSAG05_NODE_37_length_27688_cov_18.080394_3_plen_93_part_00